MENAFTFKRDLELCRKILNIAVNTPADDIRAQPLSINGYDPQTIGYHIWLLDDGGYIEAMKTKSFSSGYANMMIRTVTWKGHEFISALENETVWKKFKSQFLDKGVDMPFTMAKEVAMGLLRNQVVGL